MGFLIDAVAVLKAGLPADNIITINQIDYLAEIILSMLINAVWGPQGFPILSLVVWTLKCEVRAFGGCLGMYRR
jgi:hypothetical protein